MKRASEPMRQHQGCQYVNNGSPRRTREKAVERIFEIWPKTSQIL